MQVLHETPRVSNRGKTRWLVAAVAAVAVVMSGCGKNQAVPPPAPNYTTPTLPSTTSTTVRPATTSSTSIPVPATAPSSPAALLPAATGYLRARENAIGASQPTPTSWPVPAKPYLTPALYAKLTAPPSPGISTGGGDYAYRVAHQNGWQIAVVVQCSFDEAARQPSATDATLLCSVIDTTVDQAGMPVPTSALPGAWTRNGPQQQAVVEMQSAGGQWLVAADDSGGYQS